MTRGSIISLGTSNPVFRPQEDEEGVRDNENFVEHEHFEEFQINDELKDEKEFKENAPPTELKAHLNLMHAVSLAVGQTIGSGIFVSPNFVVKEVGSVGMSLIIWALSGLLSLCGALSFCELGTMFKRSGGEYQYVKAAYGKLMSFLYLWVCGVVRNGMGIAAIALTFAQYFVTLFMDENTAGFGFTKKLTASLAIMLIVAVNAYSTKIGLWMQNVFTILKLSALGVLLGYGFYLLCTGKTQYISRGFEGTITNFSRWTSAFYASLWSYNGWNCINMMAGEIQNPSKTVPRALVLTNLVMISVYLLANISYHTILSNEELIEHNAIAMLVGRRMLEQYGMTWAKVGETFFGLSVAISTFGALSSSLMGSSRLPFIAAQEDMFPKFVALIQTKNRTPIVGLLFMGVLAISWCWPSDISGLINYVGFLSWAWWGLCFAAVPGMRLTKPDHPRTFRVFILVPILASLFSLYLVVGPFITTPVECIAWIGVACLGIPMYYGFVDAEDSCTRWMKWLLNKLSLWLRAEL